MLVVRTLWQAQTRRYCLQQLRKCVWMKMLQCKRLDSIERHSKLLPESISSWQAQRRRPNRSEKREQAVAYKWGEEKRCYHMLPIFQSGGFAVLHKADSCHQNHVMTPWQNSLLIEFLSQKGRAYTRGTRPRQRSKCIQVETRWQQV